MSHIYFDSKRRQFTSPEAASQFMRIVSDPRFDRQRLPYFKDFAPDSPAYATRQKSFPVSPILGVNGGLDFAVCEWMEMGYGIFDGYSDGERLLSWLGPTFWLDQEKILFRVTDWRARMASSRGSSDAWACAPLTATDVPLDGCIFNYCFDPNRYNWVSVPSGVRPSDMLEPCIEQYPINVFGAQITDPIALREWELTTKGRLEMLRRLVEGNWAATTTGDNRQEDGVISFFDNWTARHTELTGYCLTEFAPVTTPITGGTAALKLAMFVGNISDRVRQLEFRVSRLDGNNRLDFGGENIAVIMHPCDAQTINYYQACLTKCTTTWNINSPTDNNAYWEYFWNHFTSGTYGGGTIRLNDGRELPIMQNIMVPQGTVLMLVKGWTGSNPNPYGFRLAAMQYTKYLQAVNRVSPQTQLRYSLLLNGAWLKEMPTDGCGDTSLRWNTRMFSNAPWLQTKWTGFPAPTDFTCPTDWPTMPDMPVYARCTPTNA